MDSLFLEVEGPTNERFRVSPRLLRAILNADQFLTEQAGRKSRTAPLKKRHKKPEPVLVVATQPSPTRKVENNLHQDHMEKTLEDCTVTEDPDGSSQDGINNESVAQTISTDQPINTNSRGSSKKRKAALRNTAIFLASPPSKRMDFKKAHSSASNGSINEQDGYVYVAQWESMYQRLAQFHQAHGHCRVPRKRETDRLERWVRSQREEMKKIEHGKKSIRLTPERIGKLDSLGFVWDASRKI